MKNIIPVYMKSSVSQQFLTKNPIYKDIFKKCPNCNNFSLKPKHMNQMLDIKAAMNSNDRQCTQCGYVHIKNLTVSTMKNAPSPSSSQSVNNQQNVKEGRILEG